jgi:hypothetical protein
MCFLLIRIKAMFPHSTSLPLITLIQYIVISQDFIFSFYIQYIFAISQNIFPCVFIHVIMSLPEVVATLHLPSRSNMCSKMAAPLMEPCLLCLAVPSADSEGRAQEEKLIVAEIQNSRGLGVNFIFMLFQYFFKWYNLIKLLGLVF